MKIYAGRTEVPNLTDRLSAYDAIPQQDTRQKVTFKSKYPERDSVTFSGEGLENAKQMLKNNPGVFTAVDWDIWKNMEEVNEQLHTKIGDYSNFFLSEMQGVIDEERKKWGSQISNDFDSSLTLQAKAYQVIHDRIVDEFSRSDRETTYVLDSETGERREETVEERLAELDKAYGMYADFMASSKKVMAQIMETYHGVNLPESFSDIEKKTKEAMMDAVSEENLNKFRQNASSFQAYKPDLSIGDYWQQILAKIW